MTMKWIKRGLLVLVAGAVAAALLFVAWPKPIPVDLAEVGRGPMEVTVEEEGKTRIRETYVISAPVAGKVVRIAAEPGDEVGEGEVLAVIQPTAPTLQDARTRQELQALLEAATAAINQAEHEVHRLEETLAFVKNELTRSQRLKRSEATAGRSLDEAKFQVASAEAALAAARAQLDVKRNERASAVARLSMPPPSQTGQADPACCFEVKAPATGRILKILQESESVLLAGAPLIEIGNPENLEVVVDLLTTDAVQVQTGLPVRVDGWGGPTLSGRVLRVDPAGFVKISALGIEEQRVRTRIELTDPPEQWAQLGHDYRVVVHITVWSERDVLTVPVSALFREGESWAVFVLRDGRARTMPVKVGHRNDRFGEVLSGIDGGDLVILHPSDRIRDGVPVTERVFR
jgi:HlyD family secretion protein